MSLYISSRVHASVFHRQSPAPAERGIESKFMYDTILVPTDGSENARLATERAVQFAIDHDATLHGLYVAEKSRDNPMVKSLDEHLSEQIHEGKQVLAELEDRAADAGLDVEVVLEKGVPQHAIETYVEANGVDLVVIGSTGTSGVADKLLGTVTETIVNEAPADVLVVRPDERLV